MEILYALEGIRTPFLDTVMSLVTHLGEELVFMVAAIVVFWCVDKYKGYYLLTIGFVGTALNQLLKLLFRIPRPWVLDEKFTIVESARAEATGYSFPSGHTQSAVGTFGGIARMTGRKRLRAVCIVLAVLVPFSRMYLGVHTPLDVGVSFAIALVLVLALYPLARAAQRRPAVMGWIIGAMLLCAAAFVVFTELYAFPADADAENLASGVTNAWKLLGAIAGMLAAWYLDMRYIRFETKAVWWVQLLKAAAGLGLLLAVKSGLKAPLNALLGEHIGGAVRYCIVVLFAGAVWPMTFKTLRRWGGKKK